MKSILAAFLLLFVAALPDHQNAVRVSWLQADVENGVSYDGVPVATWGNACVVDNHHIDLDYGDGTRGTPKDTGQSPPAPFPTPERIYNIFPLPGHRYTSTQTWHPVIKITFHCSGAEDTQTTSWPSTITAHDRTALSSVTIPAQVVGGNPFSFSIVATQVATPAGIRIDVTLDDDPGKVIVPMTGTMSIPSGRDNFSFTVNTVKTVTRQNATLSFCTIGPCIKRTIAVTP